MSERSNDVIKLEGQINFKKVDGVLKDLNINNLKIGYKEIERGLFDRLVLDKYDVLYGEWGIGTNNT